MRFVSAAAVFGCVLLAGCALSPTATNVANEGGAAIQGSAYGGQQPINLGHVYLMQANTTGYGQASVSLLNAALTGHSDAVGAYVTTNARGFFTITGDYSCTPGTQVYLLVLQGDAGGGNNTAAGEMGVFGQCPAAGNFLGAIPFVQINEVTTVAAAYALAGFATDALHVSSSGTALAQVGIANAFANAGNIASVVNAPNSGSLATTPGGGTVPAALVNTLADMIASCVNSTGPGSPSCSTLLGEALANGTTGAAPADTASALINIAHNPTANVGDLYGLVQAIPPFVPALTKQPNDFTLALTFTTPRLKTYLSSTAIDGSGAFWGVTYAGGAQGVVKLNALGVDQTTSSTFVGGTYSGPTQIAIDASGNAYVANNFSSGNHANIAKFSSAGALLSGANGWALGTLQNSGFLGGPGNYLALDPQGNLWANAIGGLLEYSPSGGLLSPSTGYSYGSAVEANIAIDPQGYVWITSFNGLDKLAPAGTLVAGSPFQGGIHLSGGTSYNAPAIDAAGNIWYAVANYGNGPNVNVNANTGAALFPSGTGPASLANPVAIAFDGASAAYVVDTGSNTVVKLVLTPASGSTSASTAATTFGTVFTGYPDGNVAVDGSGNVWLSGANVSGSSATPLIMEYIGLAAPVVTPLASGVANNSLGARP